MSEVFGKIAKAAKNLKATYDAGNQETEGLGAELSAKQRMLKVAAEALNPKPDNSGSSPQSAGPFPMDKVKGRKLYGQNPGEKLIDTKEMTRPLGSFKKGTDRVPKTGVYKLHEGEAVIPAEKNPMNAADAMSGISKGDKKPPKKIKEIRSKVTHDGKVVHTHIHHHPMHHDEETYVSNDAAAAGQHMSDQTPNMSASAPEMPAPTPGGEPGAAPAMPAAGM